jgi:hypothetical protein
LRRLGSFVPILIALPGGAPIAVAVLTLKHRVWIAVRVKRVLAAMLAFVSSKLFR